MLAQLEPMFGGGGGGEKVTSILNVFKIYVFDFFFIISPRTYFMYCLLSIRQCSCKG